MPKEMIKVGAVSKQFEIVPVRPIFDEIREAGNAIIDLGCDRYQVLDIDGYYLVIHQGVWKNRAKEDYRCFTTEKDLWNYLDMIGFDKPK